MHSASLSPFFSRSLAFPFSRSLSLSSLARSPVLSLSLLVVHTRVNAGTHAAADRCNAASGLWLWKCGAPQLQIAGTGRRTDLLMARNQGAGAGGSRIRGGRLENDLRWWGDVSINTASGSLSFSSAFHGEMNTCWCVPHDIHLSALLPAALGQGRVIIWARGVQGYSTKTKLINFSGDYTLMAGFISLTFCSLLSVKVIDETFPCSPSHIVRLIG